jgi:uncharacterized membrane protein HdeD (DUF308 family)
MNFIRSAVLRNTRNFSTRRTTLENEKKSAIEHLLWLGIVLIALSVAAVLTPAVAGSALVIVIGFILLIVGTVPIVRELKAEASMEKTMGLTLGIITALAGIAVISHPLFGLAFLTVLLVGYFTAEGVWKIIYPFEKR